MGNETRRARWPIPVAAAGLACLVGAVFFPIVGFEFIDMDVRETIIENSHIREFTAGNLKHIFTSRCITSYYPLRTLTYAIDYQARGLDAGGFKFTNGLIHLVNVYLVFWLALRLFRRQAPDEKSHGKWWDVSVAAFAAGVFGVHPVVVEPVTWVPGREELLMTLGALSCLHFHMTARRLGEEGDRARTALACYACAAFSCALACLSNVVGAVIPVLIAAWDMLMLDGPKLKRTLCGTSVLWVIGIAAIVIKKLGPVADPFLGGVGLRQDFTLSERVMSVLRVYWLNVKTLFWPTELRVSYEFYRPRDFPDAEVILGGVAVGLTLALLWKLRRRKFVVLGLLWFGLALGPTSQIMRHHIDRADRFLYLPLLGLAVALAMGLKPLARAMKGRAAVVGACAAGVLALLLLVALSSRQVRTWRNGLSVWSNSIRLGPSNTFAHRHFASSLAKNAGFEQALAHYRTEVAREPDNVRVLDAAAWLLATYEDVHLRDYPAACGLSERACQLTEWKDLGLLKGFAVAHSNFAAHLQDRREYGQAIEHYERALAVFPDDTRVAFNLGWLLAACPDERLRNPARAIELAEKPKTVTPRSEARRLMILTAAYGEAGRFDAAVAAARNGIKAAQAAGDASMTQDLQFILEIYRKRTGGPGMP